MQREDFAPFVALLGDVMGLYPQAKPLADGQVAMFFRALAAHPLAEIRAGIDAHVKDPQRGRFPPLPADVLAQIEGIASDDGRPGAEEAWAMSLIARDEHRSLVWTAEMAQAWAACKPVMDLGDEVGARMAFREVYATAVEKARRARVPVAWSASLGFDADERREVIEAAVNLRRLPMSELQALPPPEKAGQSLLLGMEGDSTAAERGRRVLRELADRLRAGPEITVNTEERDRMQALKRQAELRAREYAASQGMELDGSPLPGQEDRDAA